MVAERWRRDAPRAIAEALERLRGAGARLRARPPGDILDALGAVLDLLRDPASNPRKVLESELPPATGFSAEVVRTGLALALAPWSGAALRALAAQELDERADTSGERIRTLTSGFDVTSVVLGGALPTPTIMALLAPLVLRSPVLAKTSQHDLVTAHVFARALAAVDGELGAALEVVSFPGDDGPAMSALVKADCVVATGSDETIRALAARVVPPRRFVGYGHRASVAAIGPEALVGDALSEVAHGLALDVALWDQLGCLSPVSVFVMGAGQALAEALAEALARLSRQLPRGRVDAAAGVAIAHARAEAELRSAAGHAVTLHGRDGDEFSVVLEEDARTRPAPLHRFVRVHPVSDEADLFDALRPFAPHLAGVAVAGFGRATRDVTARLAHAGASRICAPGRMQAPPLAWRHDGQLVLLPLARWTDVELG